MIEAEAEVEKVSILNGPYVVVPVGSAQGNVLQESLIIKVEGREQCICIGNKDKNK